MYTKEMEATLEATEGLDYAKAEALGKEFGKSTRSVIAKIKSLNLEYTPKPAPVKRPLGKTKADIMTEILAHLPEGTDLLGLEKATSRALANLAEAVESL